jgi:hypothetical protein
MPEGFYNLNISEYLEKNRISRHFDLIPLEDSMFMDVVMRFQFRKAFFDKVLINGEELTHTKSNLYHQHEVSEVILIGADFNIIIRSNPSKFPKKFSRYIYARDFEDAWIIHVRLLPKIADKSIIKICRSWYNRAIPPVFSDILLKSRLIKEFLYYRGERVVPNYPVNAYDLCMIEKGDLISLDTEVEIVKNN